jgi:hypothetical protein
MREGNGKPNKKPVSATGGSIFIFNERAERAMKTCTPQLAIILIST